VAGGKPIPAGLVGQSAGKKGLAHPGRAGDHEIVLLPEVAAADEREEHLPVKAPRAVPGPSTYT
jgi:hypothetical protein